MKKKLLIALGMVLCAALLVAGSIAGTFAYLTSQDSVTNTFTYGQIAITLDETDVDLNGEKDGDARVKANEYKLMPGHEYIKDPKIHVKGGSEACYLFVKITDGIAAIQDNATIEAQLTANGWVELESNTDGSKIYYYKGNIDGLAVNGVVDASELSTSTVADIPVFEYFKIKTDADVSGYGEAEIAITAYAAQIDGFTDAADAWAKAFKTN